MPFTRSRSASSTSPRSLARRSSSPPCRSWWPCSPSGWRPRSGRQGCGSPGWPSASAASSRCWASTSPARGDERLGAALILVATLSYATAPFIVQRSLAALEPLGPVDREPRAGGRRAAARGGGRAAGRDAGRRRASAAIVVLGVVCTALGLLLFFGLHRRRRPPTAPASSPTSTRSWRSCWACSSSTSGSARRRSPGWSRSWRARGWRPAGASVVVLGRTRRRAPRARASARAARCAAPSPRRRGAPGRRRAAAPTRSCRRREQRSSVSSRSSRSTGSSTGATSSTRVSRLRGMRSAEPM